PRASRTIPFVSKARGISLAKIAAELILGKKLKQVAYKERKETEYIAVKEVIFPFNKFLDVDITLGPEMRSTGEVMGIDETFGLAFAKSQTAIGSPLPLQGTVLITVADKDKAKVVEIAKKLSKLGFALVATEGTAKYLQKRGLELEEVYKIGEGRPDIVDYIKNGKIQFIINSPQGRGPKTDEFIMRRQSLLYKIPITTTIQGARAGVQGIDDLLKHKLSVKSIQDYHFNRIK
ncbi:MAG TPA: carbamoyl phosphate synthase large subunit, partial [Halanaerobiales bacterium]|nr:carbamoyl phosphate synthase large subunit [Halanaerobiales bacterium]